MLAEDYSTRPASFRYRGDVSSLKTQEEATIRRLPVHVGGCLNDHLPFPDRLWTVITHSPDAASQFSHRSPPPQFLVSKLSVASHLGISPEPALPDRVPEPPIPVEDGEPEQGPSTSADAPPDCVLHLDAAACAKYVRSRLSDYSSERSGSENKTVGHTFSPEVILNTLLFSSHLRAGADAGSALVDAGSLLFGTQASEEHLGDLRRKE